MAADAVVAQFVGGGISVEEWAKSFASPTAASSCQSKSWQIPEESEEWRNFPTFPPNRSLDRRAHFNTHKSDDRKKRVRAISPLRVHWLGFLFCIASLVVRIAAASSDVPLVLFTSLCFSRNFSHNFLTHCFVARVRLPFVNNPASVMSRQQRWKMNGKHRRKQKTCAGINQTRCVWEQICRVTQSQTRGGIKNDKELYRCVLVLGSAILLLEGLDERWTNSGACCTKMQWRRVERRNCLRKLLERA